MTGAGEVQPQLPGSAWAWCETLLAALTADIRGDFAQGAEQRAAALAQAEANPGQLTAAG